MLSNFVGRIVPIGGDMDLRKVPPPPPARPPLPRPSPRVPPARSLAQVQSALDAGASAFFLRVVRHFYADVLPDVRNMVKSYRTGGRYMPTYAGRMESYNVRVRCINEALVGIRELAYCDPSLCNTEVRTLPRR